MAPTHLHSQEVPIAAKYTLATAKTGSALTGAERATAQLSNGALVYVRNDGSASAPVWGLYVSADRASEQLIATLSGFASTVPGVGAFALAVDGADNILVMGPNPGLNGISSARFVKGTGLSWTAGASSTGGNAGASFRGVRLQWINTGGGTSGSGHFLAVQVVGTVTAWAALDATTLAQTGYQQYTGSTGNAGHLDSCQATLGGPVWFCIPYSDSFPGAQPLYGTINSDGTLNFGTYTDNGSAGFVARAANKSLNETTAAVRLVPISTTAALLIGNSTTSGRWVAIALGTTGQTIGAATLSGAPTSMPLVADNGQRWDAYSDPQTSSRAWVTALSTPASSSTSVQAIACTLSGSTLTWSTAATTLDSLATTSSATTTNLFLRTCKTSKGRYLDFQASVQDAATPTYATYGDYLVYNTAPTAPTLTVPAAASTVDRTTPITLAWAFTDPDVGDTQSKADLRYRASGATTWTTILGATTDAQAYTLAAGALAAGQWEWQVLTYDSLGVASPWSASSFFTAANPPAAPTITAPTADGTINGAVYTVTWTAPLQDAYQVRRVADLAGSPQTGTVYDDTGTITQASARARTLTFATNGRVEHVQVRVRSGGLWSPWASARATVSYTPPPTPQVTLSVDPDEGAIWVSVINPAPTGQQPSVAYNEVWVDDGNHDGLRAAMTRRASDLDTGTPAEPLAWPYRHARSGWDYAGQVLVIAVGVNGSTAQALAL